MVCAVILSMGKYVPEIILSNEFFLMRFYNSVFPNYLDRNLIKTDGMAYIILCSERSLMWTGD